MKIAILSLASRMGGTTGDCVQANKTATAIRELGHDVLRCFLRGDRILDENGQEVGPWGEVFNSYDIVHTIPPIPWCFLKHLPHVRAKFVSSTVFWRSLAYVRVIHRILRKLPIWLAKEYLHVFLSWVGIRSFRSYHGYDILLPNSEDEVRNFLKYCFVKPSAKVLAVPNAIDPIPDYVAELPRPPQVPAGDYIVVPAVFASRKNQRTLIEAMKDSEYQFVFIGDGDCLEECKRVANPNMHFLGYVQHGTSVFYGILKYARVVCLPSNCETPGIAGLEAAALGARPVVPYEGGTSQYYGWDAEYLDPLDVHSIRRAVNHAFARGRMSECDSMKYRAVTWRVVAEKTLAAYCL